MMVVHMIYISNKKCDFHWKEKYTKNSSVQIDLKIIRHMSKKKSERVNNCILLVLLRLFFFSLRGSLYSRTKIADSWFLFCLASSSPLFGTSRIDTTFVNAFYIGSLFSPLYNQWWFLFLFTFRLPTSLTHSLTRSFAHFMFVINGIYCEIYVVLDDE